MRLLHGAKQIMLCVMPTLQKCYFSLPLFPHRRRIISTPLRRSLTSEYISHCMRISKYGQFNNHEYDTTLKKRVDADDTKSKTREISRLFEKRS